MDATERKNTAELLKRLGKELTRKRVLLVDRHSTARNNLRSMLSAIGITYIQNAATSAEVLRRLQQEPFDIIIADYQLEDGRDGQQLLEELRLRQLIFRLTIYIVATAERSYQNVMSVAELTPDAYLIKPFTPDELHFRIARAITKKIFCKPVLEKLDNHLYSDALTACNSLLEKKSAFNNDLLRIKGQVLNTLGRYQEAHDTYQEILKVTPLPFARMGLAKALRGLGKIADAEAIAASLMASHKEFLEAYDFLASVREEMGMLPAAQQVLMKAAMLSPKNSIRHQTIAEIAVRNNDMETAEKSYTKVFEARRGSTLRTIDDYTNLARVLLSRGRIDAARKLAIDLPRDLRDSKQAELASLIIEARCCSQENDEAKAKKILDKAIELREQMLLEGEPDASDKITVDFAQACLANGDSEMADQILAKVAAENHEDRDVIAQIQDVFNSLGKVQEGQSLLARVGREIVELNNSGVMAAKSGNLQSAVDILISTAEQVPNLQFLVNASKAIFSFLDQKGWDDELAERGLSYLRMAYQKDKESARVISACDLYQQVARRNNQEIQAIDQMYDEVW